MSKWIWNTMYSIYPGYFFRVKNISCLNQLKIRFFRFIYGNLWRFSHVTTYWHPTIMLFLTMRKTGRFLSGNVWAPKIGQCNIFRVKHSPLIGRFCLSVTVCLFPTLIAWVWLWLVLWNIHICQDTDTRNLANLVYRYWYANFYSCNFLSFNTVKKLEIDFACQFLIQRFISRYPFFSFEKKNILIKNGVSERIGRIMTYTDTRKKFVYGYAIWRIFHNTGCGSH